MSNFVYYEEKRIYLYTMSDLDNKIGDEGHGEVEMVEMKVSGLGNLSHSEQSLVILLMPSDDSFNDQYNDGKQMVFPIAVPKVLSPLYFYKITSIYKLRPVQDDLIDYYSKITKSRLTHISIFSVHGQLKGIMHYKRDDDMPGGHFEVNLPNLVYTAIKHGLGIFIELELLIDASKTVKVSYLDGGIADGQQQEAKGFELISNFILDGIRPDELNNKQLEDNRSMLNTHEISELFELAIQHEEYEWAEWIGHLEEGEENE